MILNQQRQEPRIALVPFCVPCLLEQSIKVQFRPSIDEGPDSVENQKASERISIVYITGHGQFPGGLQRGRRRHSRSRDGRRGKRHQQYRRKTDGGKGGRRSVSRRSARSGGVSGKSRKKTRDGCRQSRRADHREQREKSDMSNHESGAEKKWRGSRPARTGRSRDRQASRDEGRTIGPLNVEWHRSPFVDGVDLGPPDDPPRDKQRPVAVRGGSHGSKGRKKDESPFGACPQPLPGRRGCDGLDSEERSEDQSDRKARVEIGPKRHQQRQPPRRLPALDGADQAAGAYSEQEIEKDLRPGDQSVHAEQKSHCCHRQGDDRPDPPAEPSKQYGRSESRDCGGEKSYSEPPGD